MFRRSLCLTFGTALLVFACKPQANHARVASLDNFASKSKVRNACQGGYPVNVADDKLIAPSTQIRSELRAALTAIPPGMQEAFFNDMKGRMVISPEACKQKQAISCWVPGGPNSVEIRIQQGTNDEQTIANVRGVTVQAFAYWLTQVALKISRDDQGSAIVSNQGLFQIEGDMAVALLDKASKEPRLSLDLFKGSLPDDILVKSMTRTGRAQKWATIARADGARKFAEAVFAESFDSWFCSQESRARMKDLFSDPNGPGPYELMGQIAGPLEAMFNARGQERQTLQKLASTEQGTDQGLSLFGRFGYGNGPLRQTFSNWTDWRTAGNGLMNFQRFANGGGLVGRENWANPFRWGQENPYSYIQNGEAAVGYSFASPGVSYYDSVGSCSYSAPM